MMKEKDIKDLSFNFEWIKKDWGLLAAGDKDNYNMMTINWEGLGYLWNRNIIAVYVRPTRYTHQFIENADYFTVSYYPKEFKKMLQILGTKSGRDIDKMCTDDITPIFLDEGTLTFAEAKLTFVCKKIYRQDITPDCFIDEKIDREYPEKDYHTMYYGEIVRVLEQ